MMAKKASHINNYQINKVMLDKLVTTITYVLSTKSLQVEIKRIKKI